MTQDEIIEMAREACLFYMDYIRVDSMKQLEDFANLVAAKERETCAYWKEHAQGLQRDYDSLLADFQVQRTWVGLTEEEVLEFTRASWGVGVTASEFIRAIEAKLKEKNT